MLIRSIEQTSSGVYKLTPDTGSAFFLRTAYLSQLDEASLQSAPRSFTETESEELLTAALAYSAECAAMAYLGRAEHCRASLCAKLLKKGVERQAATAALDYLESIGYIDDRRFAGAWLRSRAIDHTEGRIRLRAELAARGIGSRTAEAALDEFFGDRDEQELCLRAYRKFAKSKGDPLKIRAALLRAGFSPRLIRRCASPSSAADISGV